MLCQNCEQKEATVHLTKIINGEKTEVFLCENCAEETGQLAFESEPFSFQNLLAGILNPELSSSFTKTRELKCDTCGLSYKKFSEKGLLGCSQCYQEFADCLEPLIKRIQGSNEHQGKVPKRQGGDLRIKKEIKELRTRINILVKEENFEKAAEIRDKIHELEDKLGRE